MESNSLINFVNEKLGTHISTTAIAADGYDASNLLKQNESVFQERKCFMAEHFMKCPVEVVLTFPCLVNISAIVLGPKVFSQRSKCIEVYTVFQQVDHKKEQGRNERRSLKDPTVDRHSVLDPVMNFPCRYRKDFSQTEIREANKHLVNFSGKYKEELNWDEKPNHVIFKNHSHSVPFSEERICAYTTNLKSHHASVKGCSHLVIKITWATVPVLKMLEVWGTPSAYNPTKITKHVFAINGNLKSFQEAEVCEFDDASTKSKPNHVNSSFIVGDHSRTIPNEFLDPITLALMTVPLLLPSGNTVDRVTLEKFFVEEEKNGRLPSDPFTGIVFQGSRQPIPNTSLKGRIDEFLLKNNNILPVAGKTSGQKLETVLKTGETLKLSQATKRTAGMIEINVKRIKSKSDESSLISGHQFPKHMATKSDHEHDLKSSLNSDLDHVLSSLPIQSDTEQFARMVCGKCGESNELNIFSLPCKHQYCRACLQTILCFDKKCPCCGEIVNRTSVSKVIGKKVFI